MPDVWRSVRVFVSSTFSDMHAERDYLVRYVFPRLREELRPRRIRLEEVDLRWGVTADQDAISACHEIIDECRPRFLCLLGERYGTVPAGQEDSITTQEIRQAALGLPHASGHVFFYFRDTKVTATVPSHKAGDYRDEPASPTAERLASLKQEIIAAGYQPRVYRPAWSGEQGQLVGFEDLGAHIRRDLLQSIGEEFGQATTTEVTPDAEMAAAVDEFVADQTRYYVVGCRRALFDRVAEHVRGEGTPTTMVVRGGPGSGKSALMANILAALARSTDARTGLVLPHFVGVGAHSTDLPRMLSRFCRVLSDGDASRKDLPADYRGLCDLFRSRLERTAADRRVVILVDGIDRLDPSLRHASASWLPDALPGQVRFVLSGRECECLAGLRARTKPPIEFELPPLVTTDASALVVAAFRRYGKRLDDAQRRLLLAKNHADRPLYLATAVDELRTLGRYAEISGTIRELPDETSALYRWIFRRLETDPVLGGKSGTGNPLVRDALALLAVSRQGLSEMELAALTTGERRCDGASGNLAALLRLLRPYLMRRGELLDFYHDEFRQAVQDLYLVDEATERAQRQRLADYFEAPPIAQRAVSELLWQLPRLAAWERLQELLRDIDFFFDAWRHSSTETERCWAEVEEHLHTGPQEAYRQVIESPDEYPVVAWPIAVVLSQTGHQEESMRLWDALEQTARRTSHVWLSTLDSTSDDPVQELGEAFLHKMERIAEMTGPSDQRESRYFQEQCQALENRFELCTLLRTRATVRQRQDRLPEAMQAIEEAEALPRKLKLDSILAACLNTRAVILRQQGNYDEALRVLSEAEEICARANCEEEQAQIIGNRGLLLTDMGRWAEAEPLLKQYERMARDQEDLEGLIAALANQTRLMLYGDRESEAIPLLEEQERLARQTSNSHLLESVLGQLAVALMHSGDVAAAAEQLARQEQLCRKDGMRRGLANCIGNQASLLERAGRLDEAVQRSREALEIFREVDDKRGQATALGNTAGMLARMDRRQEAENYWREEQRLCREILDWDGLCCSLANLALFLSLMEQRTGDGLAVLEEACVVAAEHVPSNVQRYCRTAFTRVLPHARQDCDRLVASGRSDEAVPLMGRLERISLAVREDEATIVCLVDQWSLHRTRREPDAALSAMRRMQGLFRDRGMRERLLHSFLLEADYLKDLDRAAEALPALEAAEEVAREEGNQPALVDALSKQGYILVEELGETCRALPKAREKTCLLREMGNEDALRDALADEAAILQRLGDSPAAVAVLEEHERLCAEAGDMEELITSMCSRAGMLAGLGQRDTASRVCGEAVDLAMEYGLEHLAAIARTIAPS